ncbi:TPA: hypothetical protein HA278_00415 [Candidatus Woesearchaeota archaeon]|nr:hypothetical protein [Candidatus Woesearchaeota archaeon]
MSKLPYIKDANGSWTVLYNSKPYQFDTTHYEYQRLVECIRNNDGHKLVEILDQGTPIQDWSDGQFVFENGVLYYQDEEIHDVLTDRIIGMMKENIDYEPMLNFIKNLYKNPSYRAINELYGFLSHQFLPISSDGCFLAYKYTSIYVGETRKDKNGRELKDGDMVDSHTQKSYRNNIGDVPTMPRNRVDDNINIGCGAGLHVGSASYARSGGVIVKVDPQDVVSVPLDHDCQKVRCCKYEVVGKYESTMPSVFSDEYDSLDEEGELCDAEYSDNWEID